MATETLIIVVGGDYLAYEICREMLKTAGQRVALVWKHADERAARLLDADVGSLRADFGDAFAFYNVEPDSASLVAAGLAPPARAGETPRNYCVVAVSQDDRVNLRVALHARDINERVRITIRQFNPVLGHKIQEGLKYNCTAISPAAHAAATFAAAAVDPSCFYALPFPTLETLVARAVHRHDALSNPTLEAPRDSGNLFGFMDRRAADYGIDGLTILGAEERLNARIVAVNGREPYLCQGGEGRADDELLGIPLAPDDRVVVFGPVAHLRGTWPRANGMSRGVALFDRYRVLFHDVKVSLRRTEPLLRAVFLGGLVLFALFVVYFAWALHLNVIASMYYVMTTMTTTGYGDITPCLHCATQELTPAEIAALLVAMLVMLVGISIFAIFTATITSVLNAATTRRLRGLRPIHQRGHVIVCGAGNVGSLVIEYLRELGEKIVVIERNPDALLVELARDRQVDLLTGDATHDETIAYSSAERAKALVGVTNSDTTNLEVGLGARTRMHERGHGDLHVVLRIDDPAFGASIKRHFGISSFSPTELTAPTIAGLARFESTRGRFEILTGTPHARTFQLAERFQGAENSPPPAASERAGHNAWVPLYVWRETHQGKGTAVPVHTFQGEVKPGDRLLFLIPLAEFTD
jgi:Trk K+ transport system NAD-binding subunit